MDGFPPWSVSAADQTRLSGPSGTKHPSIGIDAVTRANRRRNVERRAFHALRRGGRRGPAGGAAPPGGGIDTVMTADAYGAGEADSLLGRALAGVAREDYCLVGAIGHDFYEGERDGAKGFPRFTDPRLRGPDGYADYVRMATERSLERCGADAFDLLLLHNPDRTGYTSETVWDALEARPRRRAGRLARRRTRPRQRLHARPDRLLRALRRADRLGDGDPQPARAVAGRAGARRRPPPRRAA